MNIMQFWSSCDGTGRVENKLETIDLSSRKIEQERVAVINFRVYERRSKCRGSSATHEIANTPYITNIEKDGFGNLLMKCGEKKT